MEGLSTPDGTALDVEAAEQAFARSMAAPAEDIPAPPDVTETKPKARRGRPPKAQRDAKPAPKPKQAAPVKDDYTEDAQAFVGGVWTVLASLPPTQPFAYPVGVNSDGLAAALAAGAKKNATIRNMLSGGGESAWMIQLAAVGINIAMTGLQIARDPELKEAARKATQNQLALVIAAQQPSEDA